MYYRYDLSFGICLDKICAITLFQDNKFFKSSMQWVDLYECFPELSGSFLGANLPFQLVSYDGHSISYPKHLK